MDYFGIDLQHRISSSVLKEMQRSPMHCKNKWEAPSEPSAAMMLGSAIHLYILEPKKFQDRYVCQPDFGDQRVKANKQAKADWIATLPADTIIVKNSELDFYLNCFENIKKNKFASKLLENGKAEQIILYKDPITGIEAKAKPDFVAEINGKLILVDLKTYEEYSPYNIQSSIHKYGYHISLAMYSVAIKQQYGRFPDKTVLIYLEKKAPYSVVLVEISDLIIEHGITIYNRLMKKLKECQDRNHWPGPNDDCPITITMPPYFFNDTEVTND